MPAPPTGWDISPVGIDCKLYYSVAFATPTRIEVPRAIDVTLGMTKNKAELKSRLTKFIPKRGTLYETTLEFGYRYKRGTDSIFTALRGSFFTGTKLIFWVMDGDVTLTGCQGLVLPGEVFDFPSDENLEDGKVYNIGIDFAEYYESNVLIEPQWFIQTT
jgi:hypothetical protein